MYSGQLKYGTAFPISEPHLGHPCITGTITGTRANRSWYTIRYFGSNLDKIWRIWKKNLRWAFPKEVRIDDRQSYCIKI